MSKPEDVSWTEFKRQIIASALENPMILNTEITGLGGTPALDKPCCKCDHNCPCGDGCCYCGKCDLD